MLAIHHKLADSGCGTNAMNCILECKDISPASKGDRVDSVVRVNPIPLQHHLLKAAHSKARCKPSCFQAFLDVIAQFHRRHGLMTRPESWPEPACAAAVFLE